MERAPTELWTAARAAAADRHTMDVLGMSSAVLMERAALAVSRAVAERNPDRRPVVCLCGPGNNGGDGLAVARQLAVRGFATRAIVVMGVGAAKGSVAEQLALCRTHGVRIQDGLPDAGECADAFVVDALLGTGSCGAPRGAVLDAVHWAGRGSGSKIAVDIPSGVDPDTGAVAGAAVSVGATVTFGRSKPGLHVTPGRAHGGEVIVADIGLVAPPSGDPTGGRGDGLALIDPDGVRRALASLPAGAHKGERGRLLIVGGSAGTPGAAVIAGAAALRAGAGLVTVASPDPEVQAQLLAHRPELMVVPDASVPGLTADALVVGPGLTTVADRSGLAVRYHDDPRPAVWDASGLEILDPGSGRPSAPRIVTPHPAEAARLLARLTGAAWDTGRVQADRILAASTLSTTTGAVAVLKGEGTVIAAPGGGVDICTTGGPGLATAGSGDCLAGLIGGLLARGLDALSAARVGVFVHGLAGERVVENAPGAVAMDVVEALRPVLAHPEPTWWPPMWQA